MNKTAYVIIMVLGAGLTVILTAVNFLVSLSGAALGLIGAAIYLAVGTGIFRALPLWPKAGGWWYFSCLIWGSGISVGIVSLFATPLVTITEKLGWQAVTASLAGAYPEEIVKSLGIAIILLHFRELNRPWHGLVTGAMVGLGFETLENFTYGAVGSLLHADSDLYGAMTMWGLRSVAGPGLHVCLSALAGLGIGYALLLADAQRRWLYAIAGVGAAFCLHFCWNVIWDTNELAQVLWLLVVACVLYSATIYAIWFCVKQAKIDQGPITMDRPLTKASHIPSYQYQYSGVRGSTNQSELLSLAQSRPGLELLPPSLDASHISQ